MSEWTNKLKENLNPGIIIMLAAGIMLLLMSCSAEKQSSGTGSKTSLGYKSSVGKSSVSSAEPSDETELVSYYETKLKNLLSEVEGIGEVKVMLSPEMNGACILCEGAGNTEIKSEITEICKSVFDIPAHKVQIYKIKKESSNDGQ